MSKVQVEQLRQYQHMPTQNTKRQQADWYYVEDVRRYFVLGNMHTNDWCDICIVSKVRDISLCIHKLFTQISYRHLKYKPSLYVSQSYPLRFSRWYNRRDTQTSHPGGEVSLRLELLEERGQEEGGEEENNGPEENVWNVGPMVAAAWTHKLPMKHVTHLQKKTDVVNDSKHQGEGRIWVLSDSVLCAFVNDCTEYCAPRRQESCFASNILYVLLWVYTYYSSCVPVLLKCWGCSMGWSLSCTLSGSTAQPAELRHWLVESTDTWGKENRRYEKCVPLTYGGK